MANTEISEREKKIFQTGLFDNLSVQDAVTFIVLYAANLDSGDGSEDLKKTIVTLLREDNLFVEDHSDTLDRMNRFTISMKEVNPLNAIEKAAKILNPELRKQSFKRAAQIAKAVQEIKTANILERLASKLGIDKELSRETIESVLQND